jgi:hypothetical protein
MTRRLRQVALGCRAGCRARCLKLRGQRIFRERAFKVARDPEPT